MKIKFERNGHEFVCDTAEGQPISIDMDFDGPQPNHFGAEKASRHALSLGGFVGDTEQGGSCNVDVLELIPHCNGTHTETIGHIVDDDVFVGQVAPSRMLGARLITVEPCLASDCGESYRPDFEGGDQVLTAARIKSAIESGGAHQLAGGNVEAVVIRTLPNDFSKKGQSYNEENEPPFFTVEAIEYLNQIGCEHLLVDIPSVDRMIDDGLLTNHHLFWNVAEGSHRLSADSHRQKTITEMVYIPDTRDDGFYLCLLLVPAFFSDAAPSRPVLYCVEKH